MAAAIVTTDDAPFRAILEGRDPTVVEVALAARRLVLDTLPETIEVVWPTQRSSGYGTGLRKMRDHFVWILAYGGHVNMSFPYGTELEDPAGLLDGTGAKVRSVRLASLEDVARPELKALLETAIGHKVPPPPERVTVLS